jgi:hypothetical protein
VVVAAAELFVVWSDASLCSAVLHLEHTCGANMNSNKLHTLESVWFKIMSQESDEAYS